MADSVKKDKLKVGLIQMSPVWLDRKKTIDKVCFYLEKAARENCHLAVLGEGLIPGYPFWVEHTGGASFESDVQKELFAHYLDQAVLIERGDLDPLLKISKGDKISIVCGTIEAAADRGGHSVYCSLVYINAGEIINVHRKLMPTHEERLVWAQGDGHGLNTYPLGAFRIGALNCWENWMPMARTALYAQGEDLHVAIWPGNVRNTQEITRWIARESRSYVVSVSGLFNKEDIQSATPNAELLRDQMPAVCANGGSCISDPAGNWLIEPIVTKEGVFTAEIDHAMVRRERQNFDPSGHYSRPDVLKLKVNKERQSVLG